MAGCGPVDLSSNCFFPKSKLQKTSLNATASQLGKSIENLSLCSFSILKLLSQKALTQKQLVEALGVTDRAIRYALSRLLKDKIILQRTSLLDARQSYYEVIK